MDNDLIDEVLQARRAAQDPARPFAVRAVHESGRLTPRERIAALVVITSYSIHYTKLYDMFLPNMNAKKLRLLMSAYDEIVREHRVFREAFGIV